MHCLNEGKQIKFSPSRVVKNEHQYKLVFHFDQTQEYLKKNSYYCVDNLICPPLSLLFCKIACDSMGFSLSL